MIHILGAERVLLCDEEFRLLSKGAVAFLGDKILAVDSYEKLQKRYPEALAEYHPRGILLPGLINAHLHLEFSANQTTLLYGGFDRWLSSVITHRDALMGEGAKEAMRRALDEVLSSGTTTVGAISSAGLDLEILAHSSLRVLFFNEVIGSNPSAIDFLWEDFLGRLKRSEEFKSSRFTPLVAIHSPYSVHPFLIKRALLEAKRLGGVVSTHFMESKEEREWLEESRGFFGDFFARFFGGVKPKALSTPLEFLELLEGQRVMLVHGVQMNEEELAKAASLGASLASCPRSNRLLGGELLDISKVKKAGIPFLLATDGLSSNTSLSLLEELRIALFAYAKEPLESWARELVLSVTKRAAYALGLESGELREGLKADLALFELEGIEECTQEALQWILHAKKVKTLYIEGKKVEVK